MRAGRDDLASSFFGALWLLPKMAAYPTLARRFAALMLDLLISLPIPIVAITLTRMASGMSLNQHDTSVRYLTLCLLLYGLYFAWWESSPVRATPGKILLDLRVATANSEPLSFARATIRFWLRVATVLTLNGGLWLAWCDPRGRALHDRLCGSVVIAQHVLSGQLRTATRPRRPQDLGVAFAATVLAYGLVFQLAPMVLRQLALADRFDAAIAIVQPTLTSGDLVDREGFWSRHMHKANSDVEVLDIAIDIDPNDQAVTLWAPIASLSEDTGRWSAEAPSVRLEHVTVVTGDDVWSCTGHGMATYAAPRHCEHFASVKPEFDAAPEAEH